MNSPSPELQLRNVTHQIHLSKELLRVPGSYTKKGTRNLQVGYPLLWEIPPIVRNAHMMPQALYSWESCPSAIFVFVGCDLCGTLL